VTTAWSNVRVEHSAVTGTCASCHNGVTATGKTPSHISSSDTCDDCHVTTGWTNVRMDHNAVTGSCSSCHNGVTATGKTPSHVQTSAECDACHGVLAWIPASVDHATLTGSCASCHNGVTATGKPAGHFVTSLQCDTCHDSTRWLPITFRHASPAYPGDHSSAVRCISCHQANSEQVAWPFSAYRADCAGCHANDFEVNEHIKYEQPTRTYYAVGELRDCAGACHTYEDSSLSRIKESRSGEHRTNRSEW
jgi:hypothetical protein